MSEETNTENTNDGTWSGLKKTLIGTLTTLILAGGTWLTTTLFSNHGDEKEEAKTEQAAPAAAPVINLNLENNNTNQQKQSDGGKTIVIREKEVVKDTVKTPKPKEEDPWQIKLTLIVETGLELTKK